MAAKPPPTGRDVEEEVSFSWPGQQRRRPDAGVLEARVAQRRQRQAQPAREVREQPQEPAPAPVDTNAAKAQVHEAMAEVTAQLSDMGERLRAELVTAAGQAEARLNRDRDQLRDVLNQTIGKLNDLVGGAVSRDDLRQYWV